MENPTAAKVHAPPGGFLRRYVFSTDHKVIGIQYYLLALFSVFLGMTLSALMRYHLVYPGEKQHLFQLLWPNGAPDGIMTPELYLSLMTMHGTIMVFFVLTTAPQSGFGNYFLPLQIGAPDMAFPVLNMLSFWTTLVSFLVLCSAFFADGGAPLGGWTAYPRSAPPEQSPAPAWEPAWICGSSASPCFAWPRSWEPSTSSPPSWKCAPRVCR